MSLNERFELLSSFNNNFGFLNKFCNLSEEDLVKNCKDLHLKLTDEKENESDIDGLELCNELKNLKLFSLPCKLQYLFENDLLSIFPNLTIALRILLILPVSVTSGERSFSKLKLIKSYLRSTMLQERLSGLATLAIECETLDEIKTEDIIKELAAVKSRKKI
ncbi:hypothetical protein ILUMI_25500 [Ignelater luminosus]|uniref:HAT C-terminal dimerisation domain-containing protein n=1 Tax=Ignelater luminosus TaxID=2038154 RepID=A0A8K0C8D2_IGNLU|nr:hypothetical protein ILUMI_25500 [Ignelater luminosus]